MIEVGETRSDGKDGDSQRVRKDGRRQSLNLFCGIAVAILIWGTVGCAGTDGAAVSPAPAGPRRLSELRSLPENFHTVDERLGIYRSGQPSAEEFSALARCGFRSVLNLREFHRDRSKLAGSGLIEFHLPVRTGRFSEAELRHALALVGAAPKPLLIHCWHGSDRTGTVVAAIRVVFCDWSVEKAIGEMEQEEFGFHSIVYDNLPALLRSIDWNKLKADFREKRTP